LGDRRIGLPGSKIAPAPITGVASQAATDPPITSTLVKIITGTGVFMVAAVVLGIAFGGVRVVTKRFFPGKVFDRPNQMEVLQLGLSGKRIDPSDFY